MYMQEFRYGKFMKFFLSFLCAGLIALFAWGLFQFNDKNPNIFYFAVVPVCIAMMGLGVLGIIDLMIGSFLISADRVTLRSPFGYRTLLFDEIRGYRVDDKYIRIIPLDRKKKKLNVSPYFKNSRAIINWLEENYPNLEIQEAESEEREVLDNDALGITEEQRVDRLNQARKIARILNGGAWLLLVWMLFFISHYGLYAYAISCIYPLLAVFVTLHYRGIMASDDREGSKLPSVGIAMLIPGMSLAIRATTDFNILVYPSFIWVVMAFISVALTIMYMLPSFTSASKPLRFYGTGALMIFLNMGYSFGIVMTTNCMLDPSPGTGYNTVVASKHVSNGKITTYHVKLKPWATHVSDEEDATISRTDYESIEQGDSVVVREHPGLLKMPWIEVVL